jgi:hypothetical protein
VGKLAGCDNLNGFSILAERHEEIYNSLGYADLFSLLMDVDGCRIKEEDLSVSEFLFLGLFCLRL